MRGGVMIWLGVSVFVVGLIALIFGARLNSIVESNINEEVTKKLTRTADSANDAKFMTVVQPYTFYFYNYTNAKDVVTAGFVPVVKQIEIKTKRTQQKYDYVVDGNSYGYREYTYYTPLDESDYDLSLVTLNPVYLAVTIGAAGRELGFQSTLGPGIMRKLIPNLAATAPFMQMYEATVMPLYLLSLFEACTQLPVEPFNVSFAACIQQWGLRDRLGGQTFVQWNASLTQFTGFELPTPITLGVTTSLWQLDSTASLINQTGNSRWMTLGVFAAQVAAGNQSAIPLYNASLSSLITDLPGLDEPQARVVLGYLAGQLNSSSPQNNIYYFDVIKSLLVKNFTVAQDAGNWTDLGLLQYSQSILTQSLGKGNSITSPVFEFLAYQLDVQKKDPETANKLSMSEVRLFVEHFQQEDSVTNFALTIQGVLDGSLPEDCLLKYAPMGVNGDSILNVGLYFLDYIPVTFFFKGVLGLGTYNPDGTHPSGTGLFVNRTVREILHGYEDPIFEAVGVPNQTWPGLLGPEIRTLAEARAYDAVKNLTGKLTQLTNGNTANPGQYIQWNGLQEFESATTFISPCPRFEAWKGDPEAANCTVWQNPEVIEGHNWQQQFTPFQEGNVLPILSIFTNQLLRNVRSAYAGDVQVKGINLRRYKIQPTELQKADDFVTNPDLQARARNYRMYISGFQDMSTSLGMLPVYLGRPHHYENLVENKKIWGVNRSDWNDTTPSLYETYFDVEPLSGAVMNGRQRMQVNFKIGALLDGYYGTVYKAGDYCMYPVFWAEEGDTITDADATDFVSGVYDNRTSGKSWTVILIILGMCIMVAGLYWICKGWRTYRMKGNLETVPLRSNEKKTFI